MFLVSWLADCNQIQFGISICAAGRCAAYRHKWPVSVAWHNKCISKNTAESQSHTAVTLLWKWRRWLGNVLMTFCECDACAAISACGYCRIWGHFVGKWPGQVCFAPLLLDQCGNRDVNGGESGKEKLFGWRGCSSLPCCITSAAGNVTLLCYIFTHPWTTGKNLLWKNRYCLFLWETI